MPSLSGLKNKVGAVAQSTKNYATQQPQQRQPKEDEQSLATLLTREQRAELSVLISQTTEEMRKSLIKGFDARPKPKPRPTPGVGETTNEANPGAEGKESPLVDVSTLQLEPTGENSREIGTDEKMPSIKADDADDSREPEESETAEDDTLLTTPTPEAQALKRAALEYFDAWAESVILRVGEAVNARSAQEGASGGINQPPKKASAETASQQYRPTEREKEVDQTLAKVYPPIQTPLQNLPAGERSTIVRAVLLLLLGLETYHAQSRVLVVRMALSLGISVAEVTKMETDTAVGLLAAAAAMDGGTGMDASESTARAQNASSTSRKWKIGVAGVAGAALIGITGGLAAPLLAAGVGTLMGGLGLGATAAAGYLGALAGNAVLVGGLFGAYGARMTSRTMDKYAKEIEDFAFLPIHGANATANTTTTTTSTSTNTRGTGNNANNRNSSPSNKPAEKPQGSDNQQHRLRITVGISGWLTAEEQVVLPWKVLGEGGEAFALRWEVAALLALGTALKDFVVGQAWSQIRKELIKRTVLAALYSAVMAPLVIRKAIRLVDSPFGIAKLRAVKAGEVLADALVEGKVQGERPVSLVGQSLGGRVVYSCLLALARRQAFGVVENVVFMGAPVPDDPAAWRAMRAVVSGRVVNIHSSQDYILAFLYRASSAQLGVAGCQAMTEVWAVENYDLSERVAGHLKYQAMTGSILREIGWPDLDEVVLRRQEMLVRQMDADEEQAKDEEDKKEREEEKEGRINEPQKASV